MTEKKTSPIKSFTDLRAWQEAHQLALAVYEITNALPREEQYALSSQLRRAAISITSNIAEGFSKSGQKDKEKFYNTAHGSLTEVQSQLLIARDLGYISDERFRELADRSVGVSKLVNGLIKNARGKPSRNS